MHTRLQFRNFSNTLISDSGLLDRSCTELAAPSDCSTQQENSVILFLTVARIDVCRKPISQFWCLEIAFRDSLHGPIPMDHLTMMTFQTKFPDRQRMTLKSLQLLDSLEWRYFCDICRPWWVNVKACQIILVSVLDSWRHIDIVCTMHFDAWYYNQIACSTKVELMVVGVLFRTFFIWQTHNNSQPISWYSNAQSAYPWYVTLYSESGAVEVQVIAQKWSLSLVLS